MITHNLLVLFGDLQIAHLSSLNFETIATE